MAPQHSQGSPGHTNLNTTQHTSVHSHMRRASLHMSSLNLNAGNAGYRRESRATAEDNTQPRFELFLLGDGERKVTEEADTRQSAILLPRSNTACTCCLYMNSLMPGQSPLSTMIPKDLPLVSFRLQLTFQPYFAKRLFPWLTYNASSVQGFPHHQSSPLIRRTTRLVIFSAHDFCNRHTSDLPAIKYLIRLSGKFICTQFILAVDHFR